MTDGEDTAAKLDAVLAPRMQRAIETFDAGMNFILGAIGERLQAAAGKVSEFSKSVGSQISGGMGRALDSIKPSPTPEKQQGDKPKTPRQKYHEQEAALSDVGKQKFIDTYGKNTAKYGERELNQNDITGATTTITSATVGMAQTQTRELSGASR